MGFPYVVPLSQVPPPEWAKLFEARNWAQADGRLRPPHHPRLEGDLLWLPGVPLDDLLVVLDLVADEVQEIDRVYAERRAQGYEREMKRLDVSEQRKAQENAAFAEWWRARQGGQ